MPTHLPAFPDLLFQEAAQRRQMENLLLEDLHQRGFLELCPSLVLREPFQEGSVCIFEEGHPLGLRWDFTLALARMLVRRFQEPPGRVSYAGAVYRRPEQPWDACERFEVGCERIHAQAEESLEADLELADIFLKLPELLGVKGGLLILGHGALFRRPLEAEGLESPMISALAQALARRAPHRAAELLNEHPAKKRILLHMETLLLPPEGRMNWGGSPYQDLLEPELHELDEAFAYLTKRKGRDLEVWVDLGETKGLDFYTGPTLRLWTPGARQELAAGGRYDRLFPRLGRAWFAAGYCVRLSTVLEIAKLNKSGGSDE